MLSTHLLLLLEQGGEPGGLEMVLDRARKYTEKTPMSRPVWEARLTVEKAAAGGGSAETERVLANMFVA